MAEEGESLEDQGGPDRRPPRLSDGSQSLHAKVVAALQLARDDLAARKEKANFIRIIMRFPRIRAVFERLRAIHARCDASGDGAVDMEELTAAMTGLFNEGRGGEEPVRPEVVRRIVSMSEVEEDGGEKDSELDEKQFIVMCAIGFILAEADGGMSTLGGMLAKGDDAYKSAMTDVVTAYLSFDREGKGYFTAEDFNGFMSASKRADAAKSILNEERWKELDVSGDGKVEFEEFVFAFSKWVSDDDDDEEDAEEEAQNRRKNPLTPRITLALQLSKSKLEKGKDVNFTRIIMRFPKIHAVFDRMRAIHRKYDTSGDGRLQLCELTSAMGELVHAGGEDGAEALDLAQVESLFMLSDLDHHGLEEGLDAKEFIVFCAVGFILAEAGGKAATAAHGAVSLNDEEYRRAMMDIVGAYLVFDREAKGYFTSNEMHNCVGSCTGKDAGSLLTPERWRELDIDHSGVVDFEEWVHAFSTWVTAGDDDDED